MSLDWLRPHFDKIAGEWWDTTLLAYRLYPQVVTMPAADVRRAVGALLWGRTDVQVEYLDHEYRTYPRAIFEEVIRDDKTNRSMAWPERNDCDNYAWRFKGAMDFWYNVDAVGFVLDKSAWHAYNIIVFGDGSAALFEPQQDRFVALDEPITVATPAIGTGRYSLTKGVVLI